MPDLLSRLSEKLDEVERAAENAKGTRVTTHGGGGLHAALWGPSDVLRLVAAHREVIDLYRRAVPKEEAGDAGPILQGSLVAIVATLEEVLTKIAAGYGITEED